MKITTYEAIVENGQIKLSESVRLPEHAKVYIVVPGVEETTQLHMRSPCLAQPGRAIDFAMDVAEEPQDAGL
jgi:hypothetical protein